METRLRVPFRGHEDCEHKTVWVAGGMGSLRNPAAGGRAGARGEGGRPRGPGQGTKDGEPPPIVQVAPHPWGADLSGTVGALVACRQVSRWGSALVQPPAPHLEAGQAGLPGLPQCGPGESSGNAEREGADRGRARTPTGTLCGLRPRAQSGAVSSAA